MGVAVQREGEYLPSMERQPEEATTVHVRRAALGDQSSVTWLIERLTPVLVAQAAWRLGPNLRRHCDPEDLVSEAWLRLLPRLPELPPRDGRYTPVLLRFLSTTILNRVNVLVKKHLRRIGAAPEGARAREGATDAHLETLRADITGIVTAAVRREQYAEVAGALAELGPRDQEIVFLRGIEQRENRTVAELLKLTPDATAMRYHRALKRLRARLRDSVFDNLGETG
jgi:RNA polymerase sigma factor (sigma-70 family)